MAIKTIQPREGYATMEYKIIVDKTHSITFDPERIVFEDANIKDDVYGIGTAVHTFTTMEPEFLDTVKQAMSTADPIMEYRLGFGTPKDTYWLPWQQHLIVRYSATFVGMSNTSGHLLVFLTTNNFSRLTRSTKVTARKGTIAEIVKTIASENQVESVIEPTNNKCLLYQSFEDDVTFIKSRLIKRAATQEGKSGFYFYIRDNVLHFHTPDYQADVAQLDYYDSFGDGLVANDLSQDPLMWDNGIAGVRVISYDPYSGQTKEITSDPTKALRLADSIYQFNNVKNGECTIPYHLSVNPPTEVDSIAQSKYQYSRQRTFSCSVSLAKTISIRHGDILNLVITQQTSKSSSFAGIYFVTCAAHVIKKTIVNSVYHLERGEIQGQDQSISVKTAQEQLIPESKAPGIDPNILELQSSDITRGAGKQSSDITYAEVKNPNSAL